MVRNTPPGRPPFHHQVTDISLGLGGTSLINANVFLQANHDALRMKAWPEEIRNKPECLDECKNPLIMTKMNKGG